MPLKPFRVIGRPAMDLISMCSNYPSLIEAPISMWQKPDSGQVWAALSLLAPRLNSSEEIAVTL